MLDGQNRQIDYLRISVTDQCNLRCLYCMPREETLSCMSGRCLSFDEMTRICQAAADIGISKIKITGGEPLMRKNLASFIERIHRIEGICAITLTTNGTLLAEQCEDLKAAGLSGVNISFDSRIREKYKEITGRDDYKKAMDGFYAAVSTGIPTKINSVIIDGINENEVSSLAAFAKEYQVDVRFIELMPIGYGQQYHGMSGDLVKKELEKTYGSLKPSRTIHGNGPAVYYEVNGFQGSIGFISALTHGFCSECNRIRLTCDGSLKLCLQYEDGLDLKPFLQNGRSPEELKQKMEEALQKKPLSHQFGKPGEHKEKKLMSQIGG